MATGPRDAALELIGHDGTGYAAEILEGPDVARDPVADLLCLAGLDEREVGGVQILRLVDERESTSAQPGPRR